MNKIVFRVFLFTIIFGAMCSMFGEEEFKRANAVLNKSGKPTPILKDLLELTGVKHNGTLDSIVQATQHSWLRPAGKERWDAPDIHEDKRAEVLALLDQIGCLKEVCPSKKQYDRVILLAAIVSRVRSRLAYLIKQWERGVRFKEIVVLCGGRSLHPKLESRQVLLDVNNKELPARQGWTLQGALPKTEAEMIRMVFDQANLPARLKKTVRIIFVETPMQQLPDGSMRRPNTGDTVAYWLDTCAPHAGTCLVVSNQPYIGYQDSVVRTFLPKDFFVETIGCSSYEDLPLAVHLDNIARWLYQERKRRSAHNK